LLDHALRAGGCVVRRERLGHGGRDGAEREQAQGQVHGEAPEQEHAERDPCAAMCYTGCYTT
jgi:hypothetical protein